MTSLRKQFTLALFTLLFSGILVSGQTNIDLNFQGLLTDADGARIANENFDFTVKLISSEPGRGDLWSQSEAISTDENGWLTFFIPEISQYLNMEEDEKNITIAMGIRCNTLLLILCFFISIFFWRSLLVVV